MAPNDRDVKIKKVGHPVHSPLLKIVTENWTVIVNFLVNISCV